MQLSSLVFYLLPPAAGALIGYVTNKIAITMLFRPFREKRLFGFKIPFTPGIIPRQRYELSVNIAQQVSTELFTTETVSAQLRTEGFQSGLATAVSRGIGTLTMVKLGAAAEVLSSSAQKDDSPAAMELFHLLWNSFAASAAAHQLGRALLRAVSRGILGPAGLPDTSGPERGAMGQMTKGLLNRLVSSGKPLGELLTPEVRQTLITALAGILPALREVLVEWLKKPQTQNELRRRGVLLMRDAVNSMNSLQRLVVMAGQYDRTLEEKMSYLVDRFILSLEESIEDPVTGERLLSAADNYLSKSSDRRVDELLNGERIEQLSGLMDDLFKGADPVSSLAGLSVPDIVALLPAELTIGDLLDWNRELEERTVPLIAELITDLMIKAVPTALDVMNVENLVVNRIDSLDIERVESLLLAVIQKHLKWINIFGALLGAMIGGLQIVLQVIRT